MKKRTYRVVEVSPGLFVAQVLGGWIFKTWRTLRWGWPSQTYFNSAAHAQALIERQKVVDAFVPRVIE